MKQLFKEGYSVIKKAILKLFENSQKNTCAAALL